MRYRTASVVLRLIIALSLIAGISGLTVLIPPAAAVPLTIHLEAEDATMHGPHVVTTRPGYSGTGYVTGFQNDGDKIVWTVPDARAGIYAVKIRYSAPGGQKGYSLVVNGEGFSGMFAATGDVFATESGGLVELTAGTNTIEIDKGWGYYDIDCVDLTPEGLPPSIRLPKANLSDPNATPEAKQLYRYLVGVYDKKTLTGQHGDDDNDYVKATSGKTPAIISNDFIEYSPSRLANGSNPMNMSERMIARAKAGQIVMMCWHWNAPTDLITEDYTGSNGKTVDAKWYFGFYTRSTTFDVENAVDNTDSLDHALLLRDIDAIAVQLQKFSDAGVPILWRPLHEAEGGWFWWGAKGPEPYKKLWILMHDRLVNYHHLHNLIWVYCSGTKPEWYPGDAYVDVVGIDEYPDNKRDPLVNDWTTLQQEYGGRKLIALTEFGGVPDVDRMARFGVRWGFFASWTGTEKSMPTDQLTRTYTSPIVINQDNLPSKSN